MILTKGSGQNMKETETPQIEYWHGNKNKFIRWYYYLNTGLGLVNDWKYIAAFILGLYYTLKLVQPMIMVVIFLVVVPILMFIGWLKVNHIAKPYDWYGTQFTSYWAKHGYELQEDTLKVLKEINEKLKK
jgi:hypothetical protein